VEKLRALSVETGISMVRLAMTWTLHRPRLSGVLIGARNTGQIDNALESLESPLPAELQDRMTSWRA
jgi:aryl-alcohol dehydrogenase-like predicted oxidoreductase